MIWTGNLLSGLIGVIIGSIIGAIATYFAAIRGAKVSISESAKADLERRRSEEEKLKRSMLNALLAEIDDNLKLAEKVQISHAKIRFLSDAYEQIKRRIDFIPSELIETLRAAYAEAARFNVLADYDQAKVSYGGGHLDESLRKQGDVAKGAFLSCKEVLENILQASDVNNKEAN